MKINNTIKWLSEKAERYFPDRQLYFRAHGDVSFVTISKKIQIFCTAIFLCFVLWFAVTSYNYVYINEILGEKDVEVETANRNYEELENQYSELKNDILKSANALEQRQQYIQQVLDEDETLNEPAENFEIDDTGIIDDSSFVDGENDKEARNLIRDESLDKIYVDLKRIEMQQNATIKSISGGVDAKLAFLTETLDKTGLSGDKILELADDLPSLTKAQGGPFIGLENGINEDAIDSSSFDELYIKRSSLEDLEMAIEYLPIITPPEKHYVSSKFGMRRDPITKKWANHKGIDMAGWHKTPINAGGDGVVLRAGRNGSFGLFIEIDHGNGFRSRYGHLSQVKVGRGDKVEANQLIGLMGSTGRSVSTHLHYEIWFNGKPIDPLKVLKAANDVQKIKQQEYDS